MSSNFQWRPTPHVKKSNCAVYASGTRAGRPCGLRVYMYAGTLETRAQMSISRRLTVPLSLSRRQSHLSQRIPHVPLHAPGAHHRRLVHIQLPRRPRYALSLTNVRSCFALLQRRRSLSQGLTSRRGLFPSSISSSDCFPKSLMAKIIGTQDSSSFA